MVSTSPEDALQSLLPVFSKFSAKGNNMDCTQLTKLCTDSGILAKGKYITKTDVELIFARVKQHGLRKINFVEFCRCIELIAERSRNTVYYIANRMLMVEDGPLYAGTKPDAVRLHDDKSLYTGVYANGGPSTVDAGASNFTDLSQILDRSPADVRGVKY